MNKYIAIATVALMAACAKSPGSIEPVSMGNAFAAVPCTEAAARLAHERQNLAALEQAQKGAAAGDAIGVFLIGIPVSSLGGGDKAGEIAASKGKVLALESRLLTCGG